MKTRFTILQHDHPFLHWDFLIERETALQTFRLLHMPGSLVEIPAEPLPAHRKLYLEYEGAISGNRGTVFQWDTGWIELIEESSETLVFILAGKKLQGRFALQSIPQNPQWVFSGPDRQGQLPFE